LTPEETPAETPAAPDRQPSAKLPQSLRDDLIKIAFDKLLIGIVLVLAAFLANQTLERFKADESFRSEIAKTRVAKIGEVWELVYQYETVVAGTMQKLMAVSSDATPASIVAAARPVLEARDRLMKAVETSRFWLGEQQYNAIIDYLYATDEYYTFLQTRLEEPREKREARERARVTVLSLAKEIIGGAN
jgi:hypothetical protein